MTELAITGTQIQGMMMGAWTEGATIEICKTHKAVCLDGEVWEIQGRLDSVCGTVNPTNAMTGADVVSAIKSVVTGNRAENYYASLGPPEA